MDLFSIIILSIALSMDSFAVSIANGICIRNLDTVKSIKFAFMLALFQGTMPLIGWFSGIGVEQYIKEFDHWIAFILLSFIGGKMIFEASNKKIQKTEIELKLWPTMVQGFATSIDAFAVGISLAFLNISIVKPVIFIGIITFIVSLIGLKMGKILGAKFGTSIELFGGIVLIGIGVKILIEHLYFQ